MSERRKGKKKKEMDLRDLDKKPSKDEYAIAKYLKQKLPEKKTTLLGHKVEYFIASKAVDCLLESPWSKKDKKNEIHFTTRDSVIDFMTRLLEHKFFHRAKKIVVQKESKKKKSEEITAESSKEKEPKKSKGKSDKKEEKSDKKSEDKKDSGEVVEKKKEKRKVKLDMHLEQIFIDSNEPYVWIYDPIPMRIWISGTLMVVAAVLVCLFPLWPQTIRHYIYYLSVGAAFFLVFIIGLAVLRLVVFVLIWLVTFGKHHLWLLPNLTEDVGFFESFWPLYKYEYKGDKEKKPSKEKLKDDKKPEKEDQDKSDGSSSDPDKKMDQNPTESEQESDGEKPKGENGFEFVEAAEVEESISDSTEDRKTK